MLTITNPLTNPMHWPHVSPRTRKVLAVVGASVVTLGSVAVFVRLLRRKRGPAADVPLGAPEGGVIHQGVSQDGNAPHEPVPIGGVIEVGKSGGAKNGATKSFDLLSFDPGASADVTIDVAATVYHPSNQKFYGMAGQQWCRGMRITLHAERSALGLVLSNVQAVDTDEPCLTQVEPGKEDLQHPFPHGPGVDERPQIEAVADGGDLVLRVKAPALFWGDEYLPPGQGRGADWWAAHTQWWRYDLRVTGTMQVT